MNKPARRQREPRAGRANHRPVGLRCGGRRDYLGLYGRAPHSVNSLREWRCLGVHHVMTRSRAWTTNEHQVSLPVKLAMYYSLANDNEDASYIRAIENQSRDNCGLCRSDRRYKVFNRRHFLVFALALCKFEFRVNTKRFDNPAQRIATPHQREKRLWGVEPRPLS